MKCVIAALITLALTTGASAAGLFVTVGQHQVNGSLTEPVDSFVDVFFQIEEPVTLPDLGGYQVALDLSPTSNGLALDEAVNTATPRDPIIAAPPINIGSTVDRIQATQSLAVGGVEITEGAGIIRVPFQLAAGVTSGTFDLKLDLDNTVISDGLGVPIEFEPRNGQIVVVPEPSGLVLGVVALMLLGRRRFAI